MKTRLAVALIAAATVAACSDDDGGGKSFDPGEPGGTLTTGDYVASHWDNVSDQCRVNTESLNGGTIGIAVTGTSLDWATTSIFGPYPGVIYGSAFTVVIIDEYDFTSTPYPFGIGPYDCLMELTQSIEGLAYGDDRAWVETEQTVSAGTGADCATVHDEIEDYAGFNLNFPCTSESSFFLVKSTGM